MSDELLEALKWDFTDEEIAYILENDLISELSKKTLGSYIKKASKDLKDKSFNAGSLTTLGASRISSTDKDFYNSGKDELKKAYKRNRGIAKATDRLTKESTINKIISSHGKHELNEGAKVKLKPGMKPAEYKKLKIQAQNYTPAQKSVQGHPIDPDQDHSVLGNMLKGKYPWGTVNATLAKAAINSLRSLDPRAKRHVITKIYNDPKAFDLFVTEGVVE